MANKSLLASLAICLAMLAVPKQSAALPLSHFTINSKLSQGHWVKVSVTESGIYEITREQLAQMGFSNPQRIQVFGYGGAPFSEVLNEKQPDDLQQIPILRRSDKICFYASGIVNMSLKGGRSPHFTRQRNTYSLKTYYFITESQEQSLTLPTKPHTGNTTNVITTSLDAYMHERELISPGFTGSELLGEDFLLSKEPIEFRLVNPSEARLGLCSRVAARTTMRLSGTYSTASRFSCRLTAAGQTTVVPYSATATRISGCTSVYTYYQANLSPEENTVWFDLPQVSDNGTLKYDITEITSPDSTVIQMARLDYFIITYNHHNTLEGTQGAQCRMAYTSSESSDDVRVSGAGDIVVWDVTTPTAPTQMLTTKSGNSFSFTPGQSSEPRQYIAFSPTGTLHQIDGYEEVVNQNLHGMKVPDMLIVTNNEFLDQAQRLAQIHQSLDGIECAVVDQQQVFNEFSSGTPNAMGIRLLCKMLYDRNETKFKYLLLLGNISFDNRGLATRKNNRVVSYVSATSYSEDNSYLNDDFYGYLMDGSGVNLSSDKLCIGIGHMPVANAVEAASAVDKLYEYMVTPDYGPWRNNYSLWAENSTFKKEGAVIVSPGDTIYQLHESQAYGIGKIINDVCNVQMIPDLTFVRMFPRDVTQSYIEDKKRTSTEAKRHILESLGEGQFFATYVGHAGASALTSTAMWTSNDVLSNTYKHLPIMTTACCDVARIDSDHRGIAEFMFHKRDGGAIALYTTTRQVYASLNDETNRPFVETLFNYNHTGSYPRLGDAYAASKNYKSNSNKFHWVLLGDPAMKVVYPRPLFTIKEINGVSLSSGKTISARPLQQINIVAQVMKESDPTSVDTGFSGDATITIYDVERTCLSKIQGTGNYRGEFFTLDYPREKLVQVNGRVANGIFTGSVVMPRYLRSETGNMLMSAYAHQDNTDVMVNGTFGKLVKLPFTAGASVSDRISPVVEAMFLNNENEFANNSTVGSEATLYIRATDNTAFNTQQMGMGRNMRLSLDGGKTTFNTVKNHAIVSDGGRTMNVELPITNLTPGAHTLEFSVSDVCGNTTTETISFVVSDNDNITLATSDIANDAQVEIDLPSFTLDAASTVNLKVTDMTGNLVWSSQTSTFPCVWNLTDNQGRRVKPGLYHIYGNYTGTEGYKGSNRVDFVVLAPTKGN